MNETASYQDPGTARKKLGIEPCIDPTASVRDSRLGAWTEVGGSAVMAGMVELGEDIFLKPVRRGIPRYSSGLSDMVAQPRAATVMGLMEEARLARMRGLKVSQKAGSVHNAFGRIKEWLVGNF